MRFLLLLGRMRTKIHASQSAFSLVETLIALGLVGITVTVLYTSFVKVNDFADANRLHTCAFEIVQARVDRALSVRPFTPQNGSDPFITSGSNSLTSDLMLCGTNTVSLGTPCNETVNILINSDALATSGTVQAVVSGTLTTLIQNASIVTGGTAAASGTVQLRSVNINLNYLYRGRPYNVQMTCLRAPDV